MVARRDDRVLRRAVRTLAARNTRDRGVVVRVVEEHQRLTTAEVRKLHRRGYPPGQRRDPVIVRPARPEIAQGGDGAGGDERDGDPPPPPVFGLAAPPPLPRPVGGGAG